mmetsp:Transcript_23990/g.67135  ORF Transcript_23990/g.67135 Transcript_23990/m.67135 type:complete len:275 (+) Transcript_23990:206-1030(+)
MGVVKRVVLRHAFLPEVQGLDLPGGQVGDRAPLREGPGRGLAVHQQPPPAVADVLRQDPPQQVLLEDGGQRGAGDPCVRGQHVPPVHVLQEVALCVEDHPLQCGHHERRVAEVEAALGGVPRRQDGLHVPRHLLAQLVGGAPLRAGRAGVLQAADNHGRPLHEVPVGNVAERAVLDAADVVLRARAPDRQQRLFDAREACLVSLAPAPEHLGCGLAHLVVERRSAELAPEGGFPRSRTLRVHGESSAREGDEGDRQARSGAEIHDCQGEHVILI